VEIDIISGTTSSKDVQYNPRKSINWFTVPQTQQDKSKKPTIVTPTPGLSTYAEVAGAKRIRGMYKLNSRCYFVADLTFYELLAGGVIIQRGTLDASTLNTYKIYIEGNSQNQIMIADRQVAYIFNESTNVLTQITDPDFPGAYTLTYQDGYFIVTAPQPGATNYYRVYFSTLLDGSSWVGTDFYTPTYKADNVKLVLSAKEELVNFGDETIEIYLNDGQTPFSRSVRATQHVGIDALESVCIVNDRIVFVGKLPIGGNRVFSMQMSSYQIEEISTANIADQISQSGDLRDAYAWSYESKNGSYFYVLTVPNLELTLVCNLKTGMWHQWSSYLRDDYNGIPQYGRHLGFCHVVFDQKHLIGDFKSGKIYSLEEDSLTESGTTVIRQLDAGVYSSDKKMIATYELELDCSTGVGTTTGQGEDPRLMYSQSKDGGKTFSNEKLIPLSKKGKYLDRVRIRKMGASRDWVFRFRLSDPVNLSLFSAYVRGSVGAY
jgi:hypothetical protein